MGGSATTHEGGDGYVWVDGDVAARPRRPRDPATEPRSAEEIEADARTEHLVVEIGGGAAASIGVFPSYPEFWQRVHGYAEDERLWSFDVSVDEAFRGKGYGARVVRNTAAWVLEARNATRFIVDVRCDNPRAVAACENAGFHKVRFLPEHKDGEDSWLMEFRADRPIRRTTPTHVHYFKFDGSEHWRIEADLVDEDEHGWWLRGYPGTRTWRGTELSSVERVGFLFLVPRDAWWAGFWNFDHDGPYELYIDIATPARWQDGELQLVDLDLDVVRGWDGSIQLLDEDEFEEHAVKYAYPDDVRAAARQSAASLLDRVARRVPPFDLVDAGT